MRTASKYLMGALATLIVAQAFGQQKNMELGHHHLVFGSGAHNCISDSSSIHTGFIPLIESYVQRDINKRYPYPANSDLNLGKAYYYRRYLSGKPNYRTYDGWIARKFFEENLIIVEDSTDNFHLTADPLFHFQVGKDLESDSADILYQNTRGFKIAGDIGDRFSFATTFYENQARFPEYVANYVDYTGVVPGSGRIKKLDTQEYDYAMASGYVSYSPHDKVNLQFGHGKHFVGDGYRSLLLSDNAFNYPYFRITTSWFNGVLQYTNLFTSFQSQERYEAATTPEALFKRKDGSFHHLSINIGNRIQLGIFEGTVWKRAGENGSLPTNYSMFIPVIGVSTAMHGFNDEDNVVLGLTGKIKVLNSLLLYGQFMLDDPADKKIGIQGGFRAFNPFLIAGLHVQGEVNIVNEYSFMSEDPLHGYSHYNQPLAHPLNAGFAEIVAIVDYEWRRIFTRIKVNIIDYQRTYGNDVLQSDSLVNIAVLPEKANNLVIDFKLGYLLMPKTNTNIYAGFVMRDFLTETQQHKTMWFQFGFRTWLSNSYFDF